MPESLSLRTASADATRAIGRAIGGTLRPGDLVLLQGSFGAGKTVLVQGFSEALGVDDTITSPSFVLMVEHQGRTPLVHVDFFRIERPAEDLLAGVEEYLDAGWIVAIEWPDWIPEDLAGAATVIRIERASETERLITISGARPDLLAVLSAWPAP